MNDIEIIYERARGKHEVVLTNSLLLDEGYSWDVPIICGESGLGRFRLYADANTSEPCGEMFVFTVLYENSGNCSEINVTHAHPLDVDDAIEYIDEFMSGRMKSYLQGENN